VHSRAGTRTRRAGRRPWRDCPEFSGNISKKIRKNVKKIRKNPGKFLLKKAGQNCPATGWIISPATARKTGRVITGLSTASLPYTRTAVNSFLNPLDSMGLKPGENFSKKPEKTLLFLTVIHFHALH
jgi:hypothetical protein